MVSSPTVYCLDNLTDYLGFEQLCHDLMACLGYHDIEPLGGFKDKGRDAIHVNQQGKTTIFAYSVREDWRAKLAEDAAKIEKHGHQCDTLVFVTNSKFTAGERDEAVSAISNDFGWKLDLYGSERLRILLDAQHPHVKALHPEIFPVELLSDHERVTGPDRNHVYLNYSLDDLSLAQWLTKRLTAEGYLVWSDHFNLFGGETIPDDVDEVIRKRTFLFVDLYSPTSITDTEVVRRRALAQSLGRELKREFLVPLNLGVEANILDRESARLKLIRFDGSWAHGLQQLLDKLKEARCPRELPNSRVIASEIFFEANTLIHEPETLYSNCLRIKRIPDFIYHFRLRQAPFNESEIRRLWSVRGVRPGEFLTFQQPPPSITEAVGPKEVDSFAWKEHSTIMGISSTNLVTELLRKALVIKCYERGLQYCRASRLQYFPKGLLPNDRLDYVHVNGKRSFVQVVGKRGFGPKSRREYYQYHLAPDFGIQQHFIDQFVVLASVRIRLSQPNGTPYPSKSVNARRKHLTRDWWNDHFLKRTMAICQFLGERDVITIGQDDEEIIIDTCPVTLTAPLRINESRFDSRTDKRRERGAEDGQDEDFSQIGREASDE